MKILTIITLAVFILIGCSPSSSTFFVNPNYHKKDFSDKNIVIFPLANDAVKITNSDDVLDDFPDDTREPEKIISTKLYDVMISEAKGFMRGINFKEFEFPKELSFLQRDTSKYFSIEKRIPDDGPNYRFYAPNKEYLLSLNFTPDIILVLNRVSFTRTSTKYPTGGSMDNLKAYVEYIYYDYAQKEIVKCGSSDAEISFGITMNTDTWINIFKKITAQIIPDFTFLPGKIE